MKYNIYSFSVFHGDTVWHQTRQWNEQSSYKSLWLQTIYTFETVLILNFERVIRKKKCRYHLVTWRNETGSFCRDCRSCWDPKDYDALSLNERERGTLVPDAECDQFARICWCARYRSTGFAAWSTVRDRPENHNRGETAIRYAPPFHLHWGLNRDLITVAFSLS